MPVIIALFIMIVFMGNLYPQRDISKGDMVVYNNLPGLQSIPLKENVKPFNEEFNFKNVEKQQFDYSCGSAALATLLNGYLGEKLTEEQVIQGLMQYGDPEKIQQRRAFSALDMKRFAEVLGYKASGYNRVEIEDLKALKQPAILPIVLSGYKHFVVFRGIYGDHIFFADPFRGNTSFTISTFKQIWSDNNTLLIVSTDLPHINALKLTNEDLRIIDFDVAKEAAIEPFPPKSVVTQRQLKDALGGQKTRTINIR